MKSRRDPILKSMNLAELKDELARHERGRRAWRPLDGDTTLKHLDAEIRAIRAEIERARLDP